MNAAAVRAETEAHETPGEAPSKPSKSRERHGHTEQPNLDEQTLLFELDEADLTCPKCGSRLRVTRRSWCWTPLGQMTLPLR